MKPRKKIKNEDLQQIVLSADTWTIGLMDMRKDSDADDKYIYTVYNL